ncbi:MAG: hypothetical protein SCALA702_14030 [Melioribacteraceae bacterium]|nr:MAG: hypothetical protein SCALA702_14030 [Melioribacteraceae bacterium]
MGMYNIYHVTKFTIKEAFARRIILVFAGVSTFSLVILALLLFSTDAMDLVGAFDMKTRVDGQLVDVKTELATGIKALFTIPLYGIGLFLSIFAVSGFIPSLLEKGNIDLFLSKPIARAELILGKFFGGTAVVFLNIFYIVVGIWVLLGLGLNVWSADFLLVSFTITFTFMVLYTLIILVGILTRSSILAMMLSYLFFFVLSPILESRGSFSQFLGETWNMVIEILYYIIPQTTELGRISLELATGTTPESLLPLLYNSIILILTISSSIIIFNKKDF